MKQLNQLQRELVSLTPPNVRFPLLTETPAFSPEGAALRAGETPVPAGMTRLYRGAGSVIDSAVPDWVSSAPAFKSVQNASGGWFTDDLASAQWYADKVGEPGRAFKVVASDGRTWSPAASPGRITFVDVPTKVAEQYKVANLGPEIANRSEEHTS